MVFEIKLLQYILRIINLYHVLWSILDNSVIVCSHFAELMNKTWAKTKPFGEQYEINLGLNVTDTLIWSRPDLINDDAVCE